MSSATAIRQKQNYNVEQTSTLRRDFHCRVVLLVSTDLNFKA